MADPRQPLSLNFQRSSLRLTARLRNIFRSVWPDIVPVLVVGEERADRERGTIQLTASVTVGVGERAQWAFEPAQNGGDAYIVAVWAMRADGLATHVGSEAYAVEVDDQPIPDADQVATDPQTSGSLVTQSVSAVLPAPVIVARCPADSVCYLPQWAGTFLTLGRGIFVRSFDLGVDMLFGVAYRPLQSDHS
jgi:hypothetical protein